MVGDAGLVPKAAVPQAANPGGIERHGVAVERHQRPPVCKAGVMTLFYNNLFSMYTVCTHFFRINFPHFHRVISAFPHHRICPVRFYAAPGSPTSLGILSLWVICLRFVLSRFTQIFVGPDF